MVSDDQVSVGLILVDNFSPEMIKIKQFADRTGAEIMDTKRKALEEVYDMQRAAIRTVSGIRMLFYAFGGALDPFLQAIFNLVGSTIETLLALALAEGSTILGLPAAAIHGAIATSIQVITLPSIIAGVRGAQEGTNRALAALDAVSILTQGGFNFG